VFIDGHRNDALLSPRLGLKVDAISGDRALALVRVYG
jgi:hypothetical protein